MTDYGPTHILDTAGDRRTRCGNTRDYRFPCVLAEFVQEHVDGHNRHGERLVLCPVCARGEWPDNLPAPIDGQLGLFGEAS